MKRREARMQICMKLSVGRRCAKEVFSTGAVCLRVVTPRNPANPMAGHTAHPHTKKGWEMSKW
jgi:hypothetical protein